MRLKSCIRLLNKFHAALETKLRVKSIYIIPLESLDSVFIAVGFVTIIVVIINWHVFQYV